jgi:hypothetical protein
MSDSKPALTLALRLDGEDLHPKNADPRATLRIASAYFEALAAVAATTGVELALEGCEIIDKCLSVETRYRPDLHDGVITTTGLVSQYLTNKAKPSKGTKRYIDDLGRALSELTSSESCDVFLGDTKYPLVPALPKDSSTVSSLTTIRCVVIRAGGESPKVRLRAIGEARAFVLDCASKAQAAQLGEVLYREVDAEVEITRDSASQMITGGSLREFVEVPVLEDPVSDWKAWFSPYREAWGQVENVDDEISRLRYAEDAE